MSIERRVVYVAALLAGCGLGTGRRQPGTLCSNVVLQASTCHDTSSLFNVGSWKGSVSAGFGLGMSQIRIKSQGSEKTYTDHAREWYFDMGWSGPSMAIMFEGVTGSQNVPEAFGSGFISDYVGGGMRLHFPLGAQSLFLGGYYLDMSGENSITKTFLNLGSMARASTGLELGGHFSSSWKLFTRIEAQYTFGGHDEQNDTDYSTLGVMLTTNFVIL